MTAKKIDYIGGYKPNGITVNGVKGNYRINKSGTLDKRFGKQKPHVTKQPKIFRNAVKIALLIGWLAFLATYSPTIRIEGKGDSGYFIPETPLELKVAALDKELEVVVAKSSYRGYVSFYSHAGCLGCSYNQIMANEEPFDENAMTLAFNYLPLNTWVRVTNLDNGLSMVAQVTDTGGFNQTGRNMAGIPYENNLNRLADLSLGLRDAIGAETDRSLILVEEL